MKGFFLRGRSLIIVLLVFSVLFSCRKDDDTTYEYFISRSQVASYSEANIEAVIDLAALSFPEAAGLKSYINDGVKVYKIVYRTTVDGSTVEASGLLSVPETPGDYPVLSFQNGTKTVNADSPSEDPGSFMYQLVEYIAGMGFAVFIPDYPGFGSSADIPHPYLIKEPTVDAIVNMFRAVTEAEEEFSGVSFRNEYYLIGYSQGGWATMALHSHLEQSAGNEFNLGGSVCGAGPYDLYALFTGMIEADTYPMPAYIAYIVNAYSHYGFFEVDPDEILNETYASLLGSLFDGNHSTGQINSELTTSIPELITEEFRNGYLSQQYASVREALTENSIQGYRSEIPLLLVHGDGDTHVDPDVTTLFYGSMIEAGTSVSDITKLTFPGLDHGDAVLPCMVEGLKFLTELRDN